MSKKTVFVLCLVSASLASYATKKMYPDVKKEVVERVVSKDKIVTVTKEVVRPDGTRETDTIKTEDKLQVKDNSTLITEVRQSDWHISLGYTLKQQVYQLGVERRILGPLFLGAYGRSDKSLGVSLSFEF